MSSAKRSQLIEQFCHVVDEGLERYVSLIETLCNIESGSEMVEGVNRVGEIIAGQLSALGLEVTRHQAEGYGAHLIASTGRAGQQIVLGGHLDTTYSDYGPLPQVHRDGDWLIGPGTADMRGGLVVFIAALECLRSADLLAPAPLTVVFNSDEERGAPTSRELLQTLAKHCSAALFSECAGPGNEVVVSRRAKLSYRLEVHGVGKHAGGKEQEKVSALTALAHQIIAIERLNGEFAGASFNVGRAFGGIASNTVAEQATALIDVRYSEPSQEGPIKDALQAIASRTDVPGAWAELHSTSYRPAWVGAESSAQLLATVQGVAAELGQQVPTEARGGTADSNWFGAAGVPCLDGFGPIGFDDHTPKERLQVSSLRDRALLVAALLATLFAQ